MHNSYIKIYSIGYYYLFIFSSTSKILFLYWMRHIGYATLSLQILTSHLCSFVWENKNKLLLLLLLCFTKYLTVFDPQFLKFLTVLASNLKSACSNLPLSLFCTIFLHFVNSCPYWIPHILSFLEL